MTWKEFKAEVDQQLKTNGIKETEAILISINEESLVSIEVQEQQEGFNIQLRTIII